MRVIFSVLNDILFVNIGRFSLQPTYYRVVYSKTASLENYRACFVSEF